MLWSAAQSPFGWVNLIFLTFDPLAQDMRLKDFCLFLGMSFFSVLSVYFNSGRVYLCPERVLSFLMCIISYMFLLLCLFLSWMCLILYLCPFFPVLSVSYPSRRL